MCIAQESMLTFKNNYNPFSRGLRRDMNAEIAIVVFRQLVRSVHERNRDIDQPQRLVRPAFWRAVDSQHGRWLYR